MCRNLKNRTLINNKKINRDEKFNTSTKAGMAQIPCYA